MYIRVKVIAGAKHESLEKLKEGEYKVSVREPAERNLANERIIEIVAHECGVSIKKVRILHGHHSPSKLLSILD